MNKLISAEVFPASMHADNSSRTIVDLEQEPNWKSATLTIRAKDFGFSPPVGHILAKSWDDIGWTTLASVQATNTYDDFTTSANLDPGLELVRWSVTGAGEVYIRFTVSEEAVN
jgi:hypothetical protein